MSKDKIGASIINSGVYKGVEKKVNNVCSAIGKKTSKILNNDNSKFDMFLKAVEPTGANNAFIPLTALMSGMVIAPRVLTAAKRNPNDKEATKDEITEILFRDVQTVGIILFFLKALNSLIAGKASKISGLPMTNKPYQKLFNSEQKGLSGIAEKGKEFIKSPLSKLKIIGKNILDTAHPTQGVRALTNDEYVSRYSNAGSISDVEKIFAEIKQKNGNPDKIFDKVMDVLITKQTKIKNQLEGSGLEKGSSGINNVLEKLKETKAKGITAISKENANNLDENVKTQLLNFFNNPDNKLVRDAKKLNAGLRTAALAFESIYLGFGIPALNQVRLENKYLREKANSKDL